jgi:ABC-type amino acid transport substrate-binding protein
MASFKNPEKALSVIFNKRTLKLIKPGFLTIAAYANFYPVCYKDEEGEIVGLDIDIMRHFCKLTGLGLHIIEYPQFRDVWLAPTQGTADVSIGGIGMSDRRTRRDTCWSIPYFYVHRTVVYNKKDPIKRFPQDVTGVVLATEGSTGWLDAKEKMKAAGKSKLMKPGTTDETDIHELLAGDVQGLIRGSFVGRALVSKYPQKLAMVKPWEIDHSFVTTDGEVFAYPTNIHSGVGVLLSAFITEEMMNNELMHLIKKYGLE